MADRARLKVLETPSRQDVLQEAAASFLRRGQARNLSPPTRCGITGCPRLPGFGVSTRKRADRGPQFHHPSRIVAAAATKASLGAWRSPGFGQLLFALERELLPVAQYHQGYRLAALSQASKGILDALSHLPLLAIA